MGIGMAIAVGAVLGLFNLVFIQTPINEAVEKHHPPAAVVEDVPEPVEPPTVPVSNASANLFDVSAGKR